MVIRWSYDDNSHTARLPPRQRLFQKATGKSFRKVTYGEMIWSSGPTDCPGMVGQRYILGVESSQLQAYPVNGQFTWKGRLEGWCWFMKPARNTPKNCTDYCTDSIIVPYCIEENVNPSQRLVNGPNFCNGLEAPRDLTYSTTVYLLQGK